MPEEDKLKNPYEGHRERLRLRFENSGFKGFHDYEVLELLLSFALPRIDTKPIAKDLIEKYKNLPAVLDADTKELQEVKGIKKRAAQFLKIIRETIAYDYDEKAKNEEIQFTKLDEVVNYFKAMIGGMKNEVMRIVYLNSQNKFIHGENLSEGTVSEAIAFPRKVVEGALKYHATTIIIAHNHPGGVPEPSENDDSTTQQIKNALQTVNISLQEHVIIADNGFYSYRQNGRLE